MVSSTTKVYTSWRSCINLLFFLVSSIPVYIFRYKFWPQNIPADSQGEVWLFNT